MTIIENGCRTLCRGNCEVCRFRDMLSDMGGRYLPANDNERPGRIVIIPKDELLARPATVRRLAMALKAMNLSRRKVPDFLADVIYGSTLTIRYADGRAFCKCGFDIDDVFTEGSMRWIGEFMRFAVRAPKQRAQRRTLGRLRVLALAFLIARPDMMEHILT